jgi:5-carboxymethyl-2-hydroxymuconate isomerase
MPHITIQVSANLEAVCEALMDQVVATCKSTGLFHEAVFMARTVVHDKYRVSQQGMQAFVDLVIRIRAGRSVATRKALAAQLNDAIVDLLAAREAAPSACITCEVHEVDTDTRAIAFTKERS